MRLISNTNTPNDRMAWLIKNEAKDTAVYIVSAFFTNDSLLLEMVESGCEVSMVIRLGAGTSPEALERVYQNDRVHIRFFTGRSFHPKFYIFGSRIAYIGSSNFTKKGLETNQEANIEIDSDEPVFDELRSAFEEYWYSAEVLTEDSLKKFKDIMINHNSPDPWAKIERAIGKFEFNNVGRDTSEQSRESLFISNFKRAYQRYISKFNSLKGMYAQTEVRRFNEIPLRMEVDRFLWWIREEKASGLSYKGVPVKSDEEIESDVKALASEFLHVESSYLEKDAVPRYIDIANAFKDRVGIQQLGIDNLYNVLLNVHAFNDRFRFFQGGHPNMKKTFLEINAHDKIRMTVAYLLFGADGYETRISNCIHNSKYKLDEFGESCVKELYGIVNENEIPICNGRTLKSMEWLGFGKL